MKTIFMLIILVLAVGGCAHTYYKTPDGTEVSYTRLFTTADKMSAQVGNAKVDINKQQINLEALQGAVSLWNATR